MDMAIASHHPFSEDHAPEPRRWTVDEFVRLCESGLLGTDEERLELLDGEIFRKMGQNDAHISSLRLTAEALRLVFGNGFDVSQQLPLKLGTSDAPEPDITVLRGTPRDFDGHAPTAEDVALVVEIVDTRLDTARGPKVKLYARHAIAEYWIVDLQAQTLEIRRGPRSEHEGWQETHIYTEEQRVAPLGAKDAGLLVSDLLPRAAK